MSQHPFFSTHPLMVLLNVIQLVNMPFAFLVEKKSAMPYGKFAKVLPAEAKNGKMIPSKQGMLIIYVPALIVAMLYMGLVGQDRLPQYSTHLAGWMAMLHFWKRTLETLFLHKYSGSTSESAAKMIGFAYAAYAAMVCGTSTSTPTVAATLISSILFSVGILGNLYHHYLLATLRSNKDNSGKYVVPQGGLFSFVASPHYLFELLVWLGIAIATEQITTYLIFGNMVSYLCARSANHNEWNRSKFSEKEWPKSRRNLIPFLY